jgi:hypothetical protein
MGLFVFSVFAITFMTKDPVERAIRAGALFSGAMVVLGAQGAGVSYAQFIVKSLSGIKPVTAGLVGATLPGLAGVGMGWYLVRAIRRSQNVAVRILAFVGMLATTQFAEIYAVALHARGFALGAAATPNIAFVVGLSLYIMLRYDPTSETPTVKRRFWSRLADSAAESLGLESDRRGGSDQW